MAVNKNFIVRNGLEVDTDLIVADPDTDRVGIGTTTPSTALDVRGTVTSQQVDVETNITLQGTITIGSSIGGANQYLVATGTGVTWSSLPGLRLEEAFTATEGQTVIEVGYNPNSGVDVYVNGVRLSTSEYQALDGANIILNDALYAGDTIDVVAYAVAALGAGTSGIGGITIEDEGGVIGIENNMTSLGFYGRSIEATAIGLGASIRVTNDWNLTDVGIHTLSSVGIGTTNPLGSLQVGTGVTFDLDNNVSIAGTTTSTDGFISVANTTGVKIIVEGTNLIFDVVGIGSTTLQLFP